MIPGYVERTPIDAAFYSERIERRLPRAIFDAHQHLIKGDFVENVDPIVKQVDWAAQCYDEMTYEDSMEFAALLFPGVDYHINALTTVSKGADFASANGYLSDLLKGGRVDSALMTLDPGWSDAEVERMLIEGGFAGFKPYPDLVSGQKAAEVSIFECIPPSKLAILNRHKKAMTLHIPRAARLADENNVREIKKIRDDYPDIKLIIAHLGRSYSIGVFEQGAKLMGGYMRDMFFDTSAVINPVVLDAALSVIGPERIMWGTDLPVFMWHGRRRWTREKYFNLAREDFPWNAHEEGPEREAGYTFFLYEQVANTLDAIERSGTESTEDIFYKNAARVFGAALKGVEL